jgi:glycosyltransferase involved in cell wall biosynthesis
METLQVLLATMNQTDLSIAGQMNLRCGAVIANQAGREETICRDGIKMITTATRGVGLNRNIALLAAEAEIVLFADDDVVYNDDMEDAVLAAFRENPKADVLIFGMDMVKDGKITERRNEKKRRLRFWNAMRFGTYRIAARRSALLRENIFFHQQFGGGCPFSAGEDSLFLKACFDAGLRIYAHEYVLGTCAKDTSTWFVGCNEKYFYDKGVLMRYLFPRIPHVMALYFAIRFKRTTELNVLQRIRLMQAGVRGGKSMRQYQE